METISKRILICMFVLVFGFSFAGAGYASDFHINPGTDTLQTSAAQSYVGKSVSTVTRDLGSPSMVRFNRGDNSKIDYIYIGNSYVYTFEVMKELGKKVTAYYRDGRSQWENGIYPGYPKKS